MTLKDLRLGVSKHPYLQRSIEMATQGELLKLYHFLPLWRSENQDSRPAGRRKAIGQGGKRSGGAALIQPEVLFVGECAAIQFMQFSTGLENRE